MKQKTMKPSPSEQQKTERDAERERWEQFARNEGRYSLENAAAILEKHTEVPASTMLDKLGRAAYEGALKVYIPGAKVQYDYSVYKELPPKESGSESVYVSQKMKMIRAVQEWCEEAYSKDLNAWLKKYEPGITWEFPAPAAKVKTEHDISQSDGDWKAQARAIADECFDHDTSNNTRDCLLRKNSRGEYVGGYAYRVMVIMQERKIHGPRGRIDNAATIARDALQGDKWWANKSK